MKVFLLTCEEPEIVGSAIVTAGDAEEAVDLFHLGPDVHGECSHLWEMKAVELTSLQTAERIPAIQYVEFWDVVGDAWTERFAGKPHTPKAPPVPDLEGAACLWRSTWTREAWFVAWPRVTDRKNPIPSVEDVVASVVFGEGRHRLLEFPDGMFLLAYNFVATGSAPRRREIWRRQ